MQDRHTNKERYFDEQVYTTRNFVLPYLENHMILGPSTRVLEIGCGEGGNMVPFLEAGCHVTGVDILTSKIENAKRFLKETSLQNYKLLAEDIYQCGEKLEEPYDLVVMRDVIEHIHDQEKFMGYVRKFLKPGGLFFLGFPPWYNPFGGHQQVCENKMLSVMPYFHLFPSWMYRAVLKLFGESDSKIEGLLEIKETGISIERFRKISKTNDFKIVAETFYLLNPNYFVKFGLKPVKQNRLVSGIPFIRNVFTTACYYILKHTSADSMN